MIFQSVLPSLVSANQSKAHEDKAVLPRDLGPVGLIGSNGLIIDRISN